MSDPEVVVRLLAAIDERERKARDAAGFGRGGDWSLAEEKPRAWGDPEPDPTLLAGGKPVARFNVEYGGSFNADHAEANDPDAVIRLCQSHRDIVAEWRKRKQMADQLLDGGFEESIRTAEGITAGLFAAVILLARGYGIEDGETT